MKEELKDPKYNDIELVRIAYGDDLRDKSVAETEALLRTFPELECIIAPTTVGIAAAGLVISDKDLQGEVFVTGLGLPSEMAEYIHNGACPYMFLWNPIDVGYLAAYTATALSSGKITGAAGETFNAGRLGEYEIVEAGDGGTEILLGPPFRFDIDNIDEWKTVY
jgi:rhamnose transport system substrate-binding protein